MRNIKIGRLYRKIVNASGILWDGTHNNVKLQIILTIKLLQLSN